MLNRLPSISVILFVSLFALLGCSASSGTGTGSGGTTALEGRWAVPCKTTTTDLPGANSVSRIIIFTGSAYVYTFTGYSDNFCAGTLLLTVQQTGTFVIGNAETSPAGSYDLTFTQASDTGTSATSSETTTLNSGPACTSITFVTGTAVSISGANCGGSPQPVNGAPIYSLYSMSGTGVGAQLQFGTGGGGIDLGSATTRPTTLNSGSTFIAY